MKLELLLYLAGLGELHVTERVVEAPGAELAGCRLLDAAGPAGPSGPETALLGEPAAVSRLLAELPEDAALTLFCAGEPEQTERWRGRGCNLIAVDAGLPELCNRVIGAFDRHRNWVASLKDAFYKKRDYQVLVDLGADMLNGHVFLLNAGYKLLSHSVRGPVRSPYARELLDSGYLSYPNIKALHKSMAEKQDGHREADRLEQPDGDGLLIMHMIKYKSNVIGCLLIVVEEQADPVAGELACVLHSYVQRYMLTYNEEYFRTSNEFGTLVADLIETRLTDPDELQERLKQMTIHIKNYFHCIAIEFMPRKEPIPFGQIMGRLEEMFPYSNCAIYKGGLILLARKVQHYIPLEYDRAAFNRLLRDYDAHAGIGNYSKWLTSLRPIYLQTREIIKIARVLNRDKQNRIYRYEDYGMYHIIDLVAENCYGFHRNNLVYMCHPGMMSLEKYDKKYGTNLREVAYVYLMNDCNATKTAKELFIHRNTMTYKINKIEEVMGESLDNGMLKQRLLFSHMVLEYVHKYLNDDLFVLKK